MNIYFLTFFLIILCIVLYRRYFPILGIPCGRMNSEHAIVLDIRDYNESGNNPQSDMHIPYVNIRRFKDEIPKKQLHVIAYDKLELNLGIRFLLGKGFEVVSYEITNCPCRKGEKVNGI